MDYSYFDPEHLHNTIHSHTFHPKSAFGEPIVADSASSTNNEGRRTGKGTGDDQTRKKIMIKDSNKEKTRVLASVQGRRKAQNRAAQRAFRERKEKHVRDLEARISTLESSVRSLRHENKGLEFVLKFIQAENKVLRTTVSQPPTSSPLVSMHHSFSETCPAQTEAYNRTKTEYSVQSRDIGSIVSTVEEQHAGSYQNTDGKPLAASQAWDLIQSHPLVKQGLVDITHVCERLKSAAKCGGYGAVFEESTVLQAVEEAIGGDVDLLF